jgi:peptide/nickel transport system substrate-binding protein
MKNERQRRIAGMKPRLYRRAGMDVLAGFLALWALAGCFERGTSEARDQAEKPAAPAPGPGGAEPGRPEAGGPGGTLTAPEPAGPADPDATITVHLEAEPAHLNPLLAGDAIANRLALGDVYEGLLCQPELGARPLPCLAESVEHDSAGAVWTFRLRTGVTWHDGARFGPADVVFTYGLLAPAVQGAGKGQPGRAPVPSWLAADFDDLAAIEVRDEHTVVMSFAGFRLGRREAFARVPILPGHVFADASRAELMTAAANRRPVGTGPLRLVSWTPGESIVMARFDRYWGRPARAARVVYRLIDSRTRALRALAAGAVDLAVQLPVDEALEAARSEPALRVFHYDQPAYLAAVYNLRDPRLADARVRRALGMLMDRSTIAQALAAGYGRPIAGPYLWDDPDRDPAIAPLAFDRGAAAALLEQAGAAGAAGAAGGSEGALSVLVPASSRTMARIADIWAADAKPHARLIVEPAAYADVLARLREGRFAIALMAFTTALDLDLFTRFHSGESENYGALSDPALDRALAAVRGEPDPRARRALQRRVQRRLDALQPYSFILSDTRVGLARAGIGGSGGAASGSRGLWREAAQAAEPRP